MVIDYDSLSKSVASVTSESVRGSIGIGLYVVALGAVVVVRDRRT